MIKYLRNALKPAAYHGAGQKPPFFEGWYFKLIDAGGKHTYAIIPGIFLSEDASKTYAFVQVLDGGAALVTVHRYPAQEFSSRDGVFDIRIGPNRFSPTQLTLNISETERTVRGELNLISPKPWPVTLVSPGIMGWYAWMPFMECYHGVVSLDHSIEGTLEIDGRQVDFSGGRGYIEKDWGRSFPASWIWLQSNHFEKPGSSFTASVAIIPWIGRSFPGFIIGLWHHSKLYRFATYTGARIRELEVSEEEIHWVVSDRHHTLEINITRPDSPAALLHAPTINGMDRRIEERLNAIVHVRLHKGKQCLFDETGYHAGLEVVGDIDRLVGMWKAETKSKSF